MTTYAAPLATWLFAAPGQAQVIDGDTLAIGAERVRLWGIDAPEMDAPAGPGARDALVRLIDGQSLICLGHVRDRYGRLVAVCVADLPGDLAAAMVCSRNAIDWPRYSHRRYEHPACPARAPR